MIATATPPNEAFGDNYFARKRLSSMYNILDRLKKLREEGKKSYEEKKLNFGTKCSSTKIKELISSSKSNIDLILDSWGQNVVFQCRPSITVVTKKVKIKMLLGNESIISEELERSQTE